MGFLIVELFLVIIWLLSSSRIIKTQGGATKNHLFLILSSLFLGGMMAFRDVSIGKDTIEYVYYYNRLTPFDFEVRMEIGYTFLCSIFKYISSQESIVIIGTSIITILLYFLFIKTYSKWYFYSILCFVFLGFFDSGMNVIRQSLAVGIITYSYKYLVNHDNVKLIILIIIASLFHSSAIIFFCAIFIRSWNFNRHTFIVLGLSMVLCYISFLIIWRILNSYLGVYAGYADTIYGEGGKIGALFQASIYLFLLVIILLIRKIIGSKKFADNGLIVPFFISLIGTFFLILSFKMSVIGRLSQYFCVFLIILLPNSLKLLRYRNRVILSVTVFIILNMYYWTILIMRPEWNAIYPYYIR